MCGSRCARASIDGEVSPWPSHPGRDASPEIAAQEDARLLPLKALASLPRCSRRYEDGRKHLGPACRLLASRAVCDLHVACYTCCRVERVMAGVCLADRNFEVTG